MRAFAADCSAAQTRSVQSLLRQALANQKHCPAAGSKKATIGFAHAFDVPISVAVQLLWEQADYVTESESEAACA